MAELLSDIQFLPGVGPRRAQLLGSEVGIRTIEDLLCYYPYKYLDRSRFYKVSEINSDASYIQMKGRLCNLRKVGEGRRERMEAIFYDETGGISLVWFRGIRYAASRLKPDTTYILFGKPSVFNGKYNIAHPELEEATPETEKKLTGWMALYNTTEKMKNAGLTSTTMRKLVYVALEELSQPVRETLPRYILDTYHLMGLDEALRNVHFPKDPVSLKSARMRLKYEELFYIQLSILKQSVYGSKKSRGFVFAKIGTYFNSFYSKNLTFELTGAQKKVLREIRSDVGSGRQMNRLLQGDVGSGKTLVALLTMLMALDNGYQACLMAPTEILASQHYQTICEMLRGRGVTVSLLTGSTKPSDRKEIHGSLEDGRLQILIGTHALLEDTVQFSNLGMVVIDEQHRFGVAQRARLWSKNQTPPHVLVMTATPIPRTLAMTVYGDLDVSVIDELPPGRKPIRTIHYYETKRDEVLRFLKKEIDVGRQAYVVYPLIKESEKSDMQAVEQGYEYIREHLPQFRVSMVHGQMKSTEKDEEMQRFVRGETKIMVATTVIEVGVNVPNASVMVIESAQRFGLAQLHQLRGRVGRGSEQSYCILLTPYKLASDTRKRIETMVSTNDGFEIAEADLRLRGPGDLEGTMQSGMPFELKIANLVQDSELLTLARDTAMRVLESDPSLSAPANAILTLQLRKKTKETIDWSKIS